MAKEFDSPIVPACLNITLVFKNLPRPIPNFTKDSLNMLHVAYSASLNANKTINTFGWPNKQTDWQPFDKYPYYLFPLHTARWFILVDLILLGLRLSNYVWVLSLCFMGRVYILVHGLEFHDLYALSLVYRLILHGCKAFSQTGKKFNTV